MSPSESAPALATAATTAIPVPSEPAGRLIASTPAPPPAAAIVPRALPSVVVQPAATGRDAVRDARYTGLLDTEIRAMAAALQSGNADAVRSLLARRCVGTDAAALLAARRATVEAEVGGPIAGLSIAPPFIGHIDPDVGEAHTLYAFAGPPTRYTATLDWWLLEDDRWRYAQC